MLKNISKKEIFLIEIFEEDLRVFFKNDLDLSFNVEIVFVESEDIVSLLMIGIYLDCEDVFLKIFKCKWNLFFLL